MTASLRRACLAAFLTLCSVLPAAAAPALWRISDADSQVWLFGSIHVLTGSPKWRTPVFNKALKAADLIYFETPIKVSDRTYEEALLKFGFNRNGRHLSDYLNKAQRAKLDALLSRVPLNREAVEAMRPWFAAITLGGFAGSSDGPRIRLKDGVEPIVEREVADRKERGFETLDQQLRVLADMSDKGQMKMMMDNLDAGRPAAGDFRQLLKVWLAGDIDAIMPMLIEGFGKPGTEQFNRMLTDRNKRWVPQIAKLLASDQDAMVIVGAGHFAGPTGLLELLKKRGITVERIQ